MADMYSKDKRSEIMSLIRSKNTAAEKLVFKYLRKNKIYFQMHYKRAPGTPDIALPRKRKAVFIDSEFWHGKTLDKLKATRSNNDFWVNKIQRNVERDRTQREELLASNWQILVAWENDIKRLRTRQQALDEIRYFLTST